MKAPALTAVRLSDEAERRPAVSLPGAVYVITSQANLRGLALAKHVQLVNLSLRSRRGDAECQTESSRLDMLGRAVGRRVVRLLENKSSVERHARFHSLRLVPYKPSPT